MSFGKRKGREGKGGDGSAPTLFIAAGGERRGGPRAASTLREKEGGLVLGRVSVRCVGGGPGSRQWRGHAGGGRRSSEAREEPGADRQASAGFELIQKFFQI
jgi:hypothetical protein